MSDRSFRAGLRSAFIAHQGKIETLSLVGYNKAEIGKKSIDNITDIEGGEAPPLLWGLDRE